MESLETNEEARDVNTFAAFASSSCYSDQGVAFLRAQEESLSGAPLALSDNQEIAIN